MQLPLAELDRSLLQTLISHSCLILMVNHIHNQAASNHGQTTIKVKSVSFTKFASRQALNQNLPPIQFTLSTHTVMPFGRPNTTN